MELEVEERVRASAFAFLNRSIGGSGGLGTRRQLESGFSFEGEPIRLIAPQQGIWRPRSLSRPLSILTTYSPTPADRPYADDPGPDGYLRYKWRGTDPNHADNAGLRRAMESRTPLIWFEGVAAGVYVATYPVLLIAEEPEEHQFVVALDDYQEIFWRPDLAARPEQDPVRRYAMRIRRERLHQPVFRGRVLVAYEYRCALCRLRHEDLLDAAHILEDSKGGEPIVPNGISMCAIHHRAFDANIVGVDPHYRIHIRQDVLTELDGPTLQHTLQGLHGEVLTLPRRRVEHPRADLLERRYEEFRAAS